MESALVALVVFGYEYHDDYVETGRASVTLPPEIFRYGQAEEEILSAFMRDDPDWDEVHWVRIESIEWVAA